MNGPTESQLFQTLVLQLAQGAWAALGKVPNPMTGKIDRDLEAARLSIDMLAAIETRTRGNLDEDEQALLEKSLRELRMNFLDEQRKDAAGHVAEGSGEAPESRVASGEKSGAASPPAGESGAVSPHAGESPESGTG